MTQSSPTSPGRRGCRFYPFFLDGVAGVAQLNQPDGIHPTAAGVAEIVRRILPAVIAALAKSTP